MWYLLLLLLLPLLLLLLLLLLLHLRHLLHLLLLNSSLMQQLRRTAIEAVALLQAGRPS